MKMNWKKVVGWSVAALVLAGIIGTNIYQQRDQKSARQIIKIGALYPMSGSAAVYGKQAQRVADIFIQDFNKNHPNRKYDYKVIFEDVEMSTVKAVSATRKLRNMNNVDAVFSLFSSMSMAVMPIAQQEHFINVAVGSDPRAADGVYSFRFSPNLDEYGNMYVKKLKKEGIQKVSLVVQADDVGEVTRTNAIKKALQKAEFTITGTHEIFSNDKDFTTLLYKIKDEQPDIIIFSSYAGISDLLISRMKRLDINIPIIGEGVVTSLHDKSLGEGSWEVEEGGFNQEFINKIGTDNTLFTEFLWAMLQIITVSFENTEVTDGKRPPIEDVIKTLKIKTVGMESPVGTIRIGPKGEIFIPAVYKTIRNGKVEKLEE